MKDLIITNETLTSTLLVMPKIDLVIADKLGTILSKEGTVIGSLDENFKIIRKDNKESKKSAVKKSSGIVICNPNDINNLGEISDWL